MPASITLTVTSFQDTDSIVAGTRYCAVSISLGANPPDGVTLDANNILHVKGNPQNLWFTIAPPANVTETYYALGFAVKGPATGTIVDKCGRGSFDIVNGKPDDATYKILDKWTNYNAPVANGGVQYSYYIMIQRASDRAIGIIHPIIENDS
ncbi:MAG: hypothetical protein HY736_00130 [Verrucomicrobia bacterium]|nr:hypothetical protein [Verrucomicrobiota bacterium]